MHQRRQLHPDGDVPEHGVDLNLAQVLVQNRVALAFPNLPDVIKATGVMTKKQAPDILLAIGIYSPDGRYDQLYLSATTRRSSSSPSCRLPGVSDVTDVRPARLQHADLAGPRQAGGSRSMTAGDVVAAIREQNLQVAAGQIGQSPTVDGSADSDHPEHARAAVGDRASSRTSSSR